MTTPQTTVDGAPAHTCTLTQTTYDGTIPPSCKACEEMIASGKKRFTIEPPAGSSVRCTDEPAKHAPSSWGLQEVADPDTEELLYVEPDHPLYQHHCEQTAPSPDAGDGPSELAAIGRLTSSCAQGSPEREHDIKLKAYRAGRASRDGTITGLIEELAKARATLESELDKLRQLVCDFQAAAGITIGNDGDPARVTPEHVAGHVAALESELAALKVDRDEIMATASGGAAGRRPSRQ